MEEMCMSLVDFELIARGLASDWKSLVVGEVGGSRLKVMRMSQLPYEEEIHSYNEGLLVIEGELKLKVAGEEISVDSGKMFLVKAGTPHEVLAGSHGTLVVIDA